MNEWMNYLPSFTSPFGMVLYSLIVYILIVIHNRIRRRTVDEYVSQSLNKSMARSIEENRKRKSKNAEEMMNGLKKF